MKTGHMVKHLITLLLPVLLVCVGAADALAIPAFARKHRMSCKTCHEAVPKLKPYGEEFAGNGFELTEEPAPRYYVDTGDDKLSLIREFPLAVRMDAFVAYQDYTRKQTDFATPYTLKILSGGRLSDHLAYYFYYMLDERGESGGVEDAFLMFNNLLGVDLDIYLGQFQISDPLFKRELRMTFEDYHVYKLKVGLSRVNLAYDRGIMLTYGAPTGTELILEVVNGNGIEKADDDQNFDSDKDKNYFGRVSQDFGEFFRLGAFGYLAGERMQGRRNKAWMAGPDATVNFSDKAELNLQYLERRDDNPFFLGGSPPEIRTRGAIAELVFSPRGGDSNYFLVGLFNWVDSDLDELDYRSLSLHYTYLLRRNIRLVAEFGREFERERNRLGFGLVSAF